MDVILRVKGKKQRSAVCDMIDGPDANLPNLWRRYVTVKSSAKQRDSLEFLDSALSKWRLYEMHGRVANTLEQLIDQIRQDANIDVLGMLQVNADWAPVPNPIGICQFRRTWINNLAIDYLATHPGILQDPPTVSGIGTAMLLTIAQLARKLSVKNVWLEATDLSMPYYAGLLDRSDSSDILVTPAETFHDLISAKVARANAGE